MSDNAARFSLSKDASTCLKGLACLLIVLHHWCLRLQGTDYCGPIVDLIALRGGVTGVAVFFFLSSYGLTRSQMAHRDSFQTFVIKRISKVFIPLFITNAIWLSVKYSSQGLLHSLLQVLNLYDLLDKGTWFCNVIAICYLIFYASNCTKSNVHKLLSNWVMTLISAVFLTLFHNKDPFMVYSLVGFPLGSTIAILQVKMDMKRLVSMFFVISIALGAGAIVLPNYSNLFIANLYCSGIIACMLLLMNCTNNVASRLPKLSNSIKNAFLYVGVYSYEIYLLHGKILELHANYQMSIWFPISFIIIVLPLAVLLYNVDNKISQLIVR